MGPRRTSPGWARRRPRHEIIRREAVIAKTLCESVDEYLAAQPPAARKVLRLVRSTLRKALPECEEVISYRMPAYRSRGGIVLFFAGWKEHYSLYPAIGGLAEKFRKELTPYKLSKGTIRFPLSEPVPVRLIARIAKFRDQAVAARAAARR